MANLHINASLVQRAGRRETPKLTLSQMVAEHSVVSDCSIAATLDQNRVAIMNKD